MSTRTPPPELNGVLLGGRYRVTRSIERGGMGSVYEARDERIGRVVAVKVMLPELTSDAVLLERFRREALATAALAHTNIVQVTDYGFDPGGHAFLVMELLVGRSLASLLTEGGALPIARTVALARQICAALEAAHAAGVVHRDLKPGNVLVIPFGDGRELVKVVDFGVAQLKRTAAYGRLTASGAVLGTPAFMPPEQARGEEVDARADVYAVGAIVYGCLAGRKPFDGADLATIIRQVLTETPPPLTLVRPDIGPALANVVSTAMAKDKNARFASARALGDALAGAVDENGERAAPPVRALAPVGFAHPASDSLAGSIGIGTRVVRPTAQPRRAVSWIVLAVAALFLGVAAIAGTVLVLKLTSARAQSTAPAVVIEPSSITSNAVGGASAGTAALQPKPALASPPSDAGGIPRALEPTLAPPTEHHRSHHARVDGGGDDGWQSTGWITNTNGPQ